LYPNQGGGPGVGGWCHSNLTNTDEEGEDIYVKQKEEKHTWGLIVRGQRETGGVKTKKKTNMERKEPR